MSSRFLRYGDVVELQASGLLREEPKREVAARLGLHVLGAYRRAQ